jgi:hypothetical protein
MPLNVTIENLIPGLERALTIIQHHRFTKLILEANGAYFKACEEISNSIKYEIECMENDKAVYVSSVMNLKRLGVDENELGHEE